MLLFAEDLAIGLLVFLGVDVENDVHVGLGVGVEPGPHRVDGNAGGFFLREPEYASGDAAEGDRFAMPLRRRVEAVPIACGKEPFVLLGGLPIFHDWPNGVDDQA